jgi:hypothetical protein
MIAAFPWKALGSALLLIATVGLASLVWLLSGKGREWRRKRLEQQRLDRLLRSKVLPLRRVNGARR